MAIEVRAPYNVFFGEDGYPLEGGYIFIGVSGLNPLSNPLAAYWDEALTIPAANIRTMAGYPSRNGAIGQLFVASEYSLLVQDKNGRTVYQQLEMTAENTDLYLTTIRGTLSRSAREPPSFNFNAIVESGLYSWTNGGTTNYPSECAAGDLFMLLVSASPDGSGMIVQQVVDLTTGPRTYVRRSVDAGATWGAWRTMYMPHGFVQYGPGAVASTVWTAPAGVRKIWVTGVGQGGAGAAGASGSRGGGGGGSGAWCRRLEVNISEGEAFTIELSTSGASTMVGTSLNLSLGKGGDASAATAGAAGVGSGGASNGYAGGAAASSGYYYGGGGGGIGGVGSTGVASTVEGAGGGSGGAANSNFGGIGGMGPFLNGVGGMFGNPGGPGAGGSSPSSGATAGGAGMGGYGGGGGGGTGLSGAGAGGAGGAPFIVIEW